MTQHRSQMTQHHSQATTSHGPPRRLRRSRGRLLVSGLVIAMTAVLIVTGCTSPQASPPPSTSGSSTKPPVETTTPAPPPTTAAAIYKPATDRGPAENVPVPVLPEAAKEFSKEGLVAFAEYWFSTLGYVFETGDSGPMMAITDPGCKTCAYVNEPLAAIYAEGGWVVGGQMQVAQTFSYFTQLPDADYQAQVEVLQIRVVYYNADGTVRKQYPQHPARTNIVNAHWVDGRWTATTSEPLKRDS